MDFDSLKISGDGGVKSYETAESVNLGKNAENKIKSDVNVKINSDRQNYFKKEDADGNVQSQYKGNYEESLDKAVQMANKKIAHTNKAFSYSIHEKTKQVMVKITDSDTGEVIREIPSEKSLDLFAKLQELAGILIDEKR